MGYVEFSHRVFKKPSKKLSFLIADIEDDLKKAFLPYTIEEYTSTLLMTCILIGGSTGLLTLFAFFFVLRNIMLSIMGAFFLSIVMIVIIIISFMLYPSQVSETRKRKIDNSIYFATTYMATIAGTGISIDKMFGIIGKFKEFGEISRVASRISRDIEVFGMDISEAIEKAIRITPSKEFNDLLWGIRSTILSGGDLLVYLKQRTKSLLADYKRKLEQFTRTLSLYLEMYITLIMVGTVFTLVLTTIMSLIGGFLQQIQLIQMLLVVIVLPFISSIYIILLKTISPSET
jgi:flagellar protein FlaJ